MKNAWFGGRKYGLTDKQFAQLNEYVTSQLYPTVSNPKSQGKRQIKESELIALEWLTKNSIDPIPDLFAPTAIILLLMSACVMLIDYIFFDVQGMVFGQILIAALTTGTGVNSVTPNQSQVESDVVIGDIDTAMPIQGLKVNIDGDTTIDVQGSQPLISVLSKLSQFMTGSGIIGLIIKIATGRLFCNAAQITFTNAGATTPTVYWYSMRGGMMKGGANGVPIRARTVSINPSTSQIYNGTDFAYLAVTNPTNITSFDFTFADGSTQQNVSVIETDAMFAKSNETEANGRLDALVTCIDNSRRNITTVRINVAATAVTVMTVK